MIRHKVESKRDVIFDGMIYRPNEDGYVDLPQVFESDDCKPVEDADADSDDADSADPEPVKPVEPEPLEPVAPIEHIDPVDAEGNGGDTEPDMPEGEKE